MCLSESCLCVQQCTKERRQRRNQPGQWGQGQGEQQGKQWSSWIQRQMEEEVKKKGRKWMRSPTEEELTQIKEPIEQNDQTGETIT